MNDFSNINLAGANIKNLNFGSVKETNVKHCTNVVTGDNAVFTVNKTEIRGGTVDGPETRSVPAQKPEKPDEKNGDGDESKISIPEEYKKMVCFSENFVSSVIVKLEEYRKEAGGESPGKAGAYAEIASPALADGLRSGKVPASLASKGSQLVCVGIGGEIHRKKARRVTGVLDRFNEEDLRRDLCKAGIFIFHLFNGSLGKDFKTEGNMKNRLKLCAIEARDRITDFANRKDDHDPNVKDSQNSIVHLCITGLWRGKSKSLSKKLLHNTEYVNVFDKLTSSLPLPQNPENPVEEKDLETSVEDLIKMILSRLS